MKNFFVLILFTLAFLPAQVFADNASIVKSIVSHPVAFQELKTLNYLVFMQKATFTVKDLRGLLRNYAGSSAYASSSAGGGSFNSIGGSGAAAKNPNPHCVSYQFLLGKKGIVKEKINTLCLSRVYYGSRNWYGAWVKNYLNLSPALPKRQKALAKFVYKVLKTFPSVSQNINKQGRHYQTSLYIAAARGESYVVYDLLNDCNINPAITSYSVGNVASNSEGGALPYLNNYQYIWTSYFHKSGPAYAEYKYYTWTTNNVYPIMVYSRNVPKPSAFDVALRTKLKKITEYFLYGINGTFYTVFSRKYSQVDWLKEKHKPAYYKHPFNIKRNPYLKYKPVCK